MTVIEAHLGTICQHLWYVHSCECQCHLIYIQECLFHYQYTPYHQTRWVHCPVHNKQSTSLRHLMSEEELSVGDHHTPNDSLVPGLSTSYPSWRHTTLASLLPKRSSHTVPHVWPLHTSTLPWLLVEPPTSCTDPCVQLPTTNPIPIQYKINDDNKLMFNFH